MTPHQRELLRRAILRVLAANATRYGISADTLRHFLRPEGFPAARLEEVDLELLYLEGKGFVFIPTKSMSPENQTWKITDAGQLENERG
jgi:hypothetical protein